MIIIVNSLFTSFSIDLDLKLILIFYSNKYKSDIYNKTQKIYNL